MLTGRCLCGDVRFTAEGRPNWVGHCHCESCRRATSSPVTTFFAITNGAWSWTGVAPRVFESRSGVRRAFCPRCGSPMAYDADHWPEETHFYVASLEEPTALTPESQFHSDERLPWIPDLGLPHG